MNTKNWEYEVAENDRVGGYFFERIRAARKPVMPTGSCGRRRSRSGRETTASRANRTRIAGQKGGIHRRRRRKQLG